MGDVKKLYEGYFSVIVPDNLKKLLNGDILKLRDAVTEFSEFLGKYGEIASGVEKSFSNESDPTSWIFYHSLSFAFPDSKIIVGIKTGNEKMFYNLCSGIVDGSVKIYLRGNVQISKNDIEGVDTDIKKVTIKKIETFCRGMLHSYSPGVDRIVNISETKNSKQPLEKFDTVKSVENLIVENINRDLKMVDETWMLDERGKWNTADINSLLEYIKKYKLINND